MRMSLDEILGEAAFRTTQFLIYVAPFPGQLVMLNGGLTLQQVNEKFWKVFNHHFA